MKKFNLRLIVFFLATVGLLIFFHTVGWLAPVERMFYFVLNPAGARLQSWSSQIAQKYSNSVQQGDLAAKAGDLEQKVERLTVENAALKKLQDENSVLRQHLKFLESGTPKKYVLANVVSREILNGPEESLGDLVIDKGRGDGVMNGLAVLDEAGAVAGKITGVEEKISRVTLVTNSGCKMAATLQNVNRTIGVTSGNLGLTINMDYIPQVENVSVGDLAVTSGLETNIPRGLLIGQVAKVDRGSNDIWQSVNIQPAANLDNLTIVSVIIK
ncbi:MAG: rod shape-determining protein MreC [Patescibacteria group bacterium]|nr:rod shape-determining protein MreC [Patescibacteria group bacterium]